MSRFGAYVVERELGRGGMGVVYAAVHQVLERRAAIKVLRPEVSQSNTGNTLHMVAPCHELALIDKASVPWDLCIAAICAIQPMNGGVFISQAPAEQRAELRARCSAGH